MHSSTACQPPDRPLQPPLDLRTSVPYESLEKRVSTFTEQSGGGVSCLVHDWSRLSACYERSGSRLCVQ